MNDIKTCIWVRGGREKERFGKVAKQQDFSGGEEEEKWKTILALDTVDESSSVSDVGARRGQSQLQKERKDVDSLRGL